MGRWQPQLVEEQDRGVASEDGGVDQGAMAGQEQKPTAAVAPAVQELQVHGCFLATVSIQIKTWWIASLTSLH